jgi:hypothetical protein
MVVSTSGCGGAPSAPAEPGVRARSGDSKAGPEERSPGGNERTAVSIRDPRTKWINDIPYDAFFDRPLEVASDNTALTPTAPSSVAAVTPPNPPTASVKPESPMPAGSDTAGPRDWEKIAPIDVLVEETKQLRNRLSTNLQTVATYNRNYELIARDGLVLSTLAAVVAAHPGAVNWKEKAKFVRELANQVYLSASGTGSKPYEATKTPFEQIVAILDGGPPPDLEVEDQVPLGDFADRGTLMKHVEQSIGWLKSEVNTESRMKEYKERVVREASVLAAFGQVISDPSYTSADEPAYQGFVKEFVDGNVGMAQAAVGDNFPDFEAARNRVQTSCGVCHQKYKDTGSAF